MLLDGSIHISNYIFLHYTMFRICMIGFFIMHWCYFCTFSIDICLYFECFEDTKFVPKAKAPLAFGVDK